jgi:threonylcarbamoyladenosine tRNA methylthiotransferase MtaB
MKRSQIRVAFQSLGCKVNQYEALKLGAQFASAGYVLCQPTEEADVYILNTCTVTGIADRTSRKIIRRAAKKNKRALIVVTGCHAANWNDNLDGVEVLKIPQTEKDTLFQRVEEKLFGISPEIPQNLSYHTILPLSGRTKAYLKIQDGCDRFCTYCIIPFVRGRSRSKPTEEVLREAQLASKRKLVFPFRKTFIHPIFRQIPPKFHRSVRHG